MASERALDRPCFDGVQDQGLVFLDGLGELDERLEAAAPGPGDPAAQQGAGVGQLDGLEDRPELLLEQVGPVEPAVGLGDPGERGALVAGQVRRVFQQRPPAVLQRGGLVVVPAGAQPVDHGAADLVEGLGGPGHDVERVQAQHRGGGARGDHVVDPLRAVGGDVGELPGPFGAQVVEEPVQRRGVAVLARPYQPARVVIDHDQQVALALAVADLVDPDPAQPGQPVDRGRRGRPPPG